MGGEDKKAKKDLDDTLSESVVELAKIADIISTERVGIAEEDRFDGVRNSNYFQFITQFNTLTRRLKDPEARLSYLRKWTKGVAKDAISCTLYREATDPAGALEDALGILERRFGQTHRMMEVQINTLTKGKQCKREDGDSLYDLLQEIYHARESTRLIPGGLTELRSPHVLKDLLRNRVPFLQGEWMKYSCHATRSGRDLDIDLFNVQICVVLY